MKTNESEKRKRMKPRENGGRHEPKKLKKKTN